MEHLHFESPREVLFGQDMLSRIGSISARFGRRAVLVSEAAMAEAGYIERVKDLLQRKGVECIVYSEINNGASAETVDAVAALMRGGKAQMVISLGGMRVSSVSFAAALIGGGSESVEDLLGGERETENPLPYIEIPASGRSHFMMRRDSVLPSGPGGSPVIIRTERETEKTVIIDPSLGSSLSRKSLGAVLMDVLLASLEGYISKQSNFLSDTLLLRAVECAVTAVEQLSGKAEEGSPVTTAFQAGLLSSMGLSMSSQGAGGALVYAINALRGIPKTWIATALLPHIIDSSIGARADKIAHVARILGEDTEGIRTGEAAFRTSAVMRRLIGRLALPARLRDFGLELDELMELAEAAVELEMMNYLPAPYTPEGLFDIIKQAY